MCEPTPSDVEPPQWRGWYRSHRRQPWRLVAEAATETECHEELLAASRRLSDRGGDLLLLPGDVDPNEKRLLR